MKLLDNKKNHDLQKKFRQKLEGTIKSYEGKDLNEMELKLIKGLMMRSMEDKDKNIDRIMETLKKYLLKLLK
jgi:hypothetical protein